jgi:CheY-like chemotaxis protein
MKKQKVLIVDDNPHFAKALKFMLLNSFNERIEDITIVKDGEECISELNQQLYDMVWILICPKRME